MFPFRVYRFEGGFFCWFDLFRKGWTIQYRNNTRLQKSFHKCRRGSDSLVAGIFTAPVSGYYYFRFTAFNNKNGEWLAVNLYHNSERMLHNSEQANGHTSISNALILRVLKGGVVYLRLPANSALNDNTDTFNTFSGFLL